MTTKKESKTAADNEKPSTMEYVSISLLPRVVAGNSASSEADIPGAGPAAPEPPPLTKDA
jgi:hypothetical protein